MGEHGLLRDLAPAGLIDGLRDAGHYGPFAFEHGFIRSGHRTVLPIGPTPGNPDLRRLVGEFNADILNRLVAEAAQARDPVDPRSIAAAAE